MQFQIVRDITVSELAKGLELDFRGSGEQSIKLIGSLANAKSSVLTFANKQQESRLNGVVIGFEDTNAES